MAMRLVFLGSPSEVTAPLQGILDACRSRDDIELVGIVSQPAKPAGRGGKLQDPPVAEFAKTHNIPLLQPRLARDPEFLRQFAAWEPDVAITAAYGQILTPEFLAIPKRATINIHPSMIPEYRGATPVQSALLAGDDMTGITVLFTVLALDAGNIITQTPQTIHQDETSGQLTQRMFTLSTTLVLDALEKLKDPAFTGTPQDPLRVSTCRKIHKQDGDIDWSLPASKIHNRYRAFSPWPGVFTFCQGRRLAITKMRTTPRKPQSTAQPGDVQFNKPEKCLEVVTGDGEMIQIETLTPAGGKNIDAAAFWNGLKVRDHVRFERQPASGATA